MLAQFLKVTGGISSDTIVLAGIFIAFFFYTIYSGKNRTISLILAYYPAVLLFKTFPFMDKILFLQGQQLVTLNKLAVFLIFFVLLSIIINRYIFAESGSGSMHVLRIGGLSLVCLVLTLIFSYTILDLSGFYNFGSGVDMLFSTPEYVWGLNLLPLAFLLFL